MWRQFSRVGDLHSANLKFAACKNGKIYCQPSSGSCFRRKWGRERRISIWMSRFLGRRTTWRFKSRNGPSPGSIAAHSNVFEMIPGITRSAVTRVSHIKTRFEPIKNNASDHDTETPQIWQQRCCLTSLPPIKNVWNRWLQLLLLMFNQGQRWQWMSISYLSEENLPFSNTCAFVSWGSSTKAWLTLWRRIRPSQTSGPVDCGGGYLHGSRGVTWSRVAYRNCVACRIAQCGWSTLGCSTLLE